MENIKNKINSLYGINKDDIENQVENIKIKLIELIESEHIEYLDTDRTIRKWV